MWDREAGEAALRVFMRGDQTAAEAARVRFCAAPGTSTWNSFAGRRRDMLETTRNAAEAMKKAVKHLEQFLENQRV